MPAAIIAARRHFSILISSPSSFRTDPTLICRHADGAGGLRKRSFH
jgi:hypothetical protein